MDDFDEELKAIEREKRLWLFVCATLCLVCGFFWVVGKLFPSFLVLQAL